MRKYRFLIGCGIFQFFPSIAFAITPEKKEAFLRLFQWDKLFWTLLAILILTLFSKLLRFIFEKVAGNTKKRLILFKIRTILVFLIYIFGAFFIIRGIWEFTHESMILLAATFAVAVGFAFKDLASSIIGGFIVLFDGPFQVGDRVTFKGIYGDVKSIGLRATRLVTLDDTLVTVPNRLISDEAVFSGNAGVLEMMVVVDFYVALHADLPLATHLVREAMAYNGYVDLQKSMIVLAKEMVLGPAVVYQVRAKAYVKDFLKEKIFETELTLKVHELFQKNKIPRLYEALLIKNSPT